ncbi:signal peptide peptidase SppA [Anaeromyxobacter diazotrophicus]|uniref:Peptidase S49 domain-containing protein n=1 Tax=Anaeromyxobacter diazotrophicus TaxID=2590199 RepID=A0A7I9VSY6_9BACT|nr:signal peptide peptidase SppA [Anaeromyxobacter diazotrophicus]GEJ59411.1 hypothetical protein AMYX_41520 [Anaeromyxobacter diazotrophicus]
MSPCVKLAAALAAALPLAAAAQTANLQGRALGAPGGLAVPGLSLAGAEEPTAVQLNPAGTGFVAAPTLQYFHEGRRGTGLGEDGFWLTVPAFGLVPTLAMEWIRPQDGGGARFRKTTFALALPAGQLASLAVAGNFYSSPDPALQKLWSLDAGLTLRPTRHLSLGLAVRGMNAELSGRRLPIGYDLGAATRLLGDGLTLSADLLSDDQGRGDLIARAVALGVGVELASGLGLRGQLQLPAHAGQTGPYGQVYGQLALVLDAPHAGVTLGGGGGQGMDQSWVVGARLSAERYRGRGFIPQPVPNLDLARALSRSRSLLFPVDRDRWGALLARLRQVRDDPSVPGLVVRIDDLPVGHARAEELRRLLLEVKARKPVVAYLAGGGLKEYHLATAATAVLVPPSAALFPAGLASTTPFLARGLGKLGVTFDVVAVGRYKSAPDPLVREDMSEAQREVTEAVQADVFDREVRAVAEARHLPEARVRELVDTGVFSADEARQAGLVDGLAWPDELELAVAARVGHRVRLAAGLDESPPRAAQRWGPRHKIAVVRVEGAIAAGRSRSAPLGDDGIAGAETIAALVKRAAGDREVAAIVLRVDSPGGDGLASDLIWREVVQARRAGKPVVASMGDLAASGGYLVSVAADAIVAEPSTLTGSIGVFALKPDLSGLLGKLGVSTVTVKRGRHADLQSFTRRWTEEERALVEREVRAFYGVFVSRVAEGRHLGREAVEQVAQGRVWTGAQALERGLVDALGTFDDAVRLAKERAGLPADEEVELAAFEPEHGFLGDLAGGLELQADAGPLDAIARLPELRAVSLLLEVGPLVALPPGWFGAWEGSGAGQEPGAEAGPGPR